jgi:hypothetical protein
MNDFSNTSIDCFPKEILQYILRYAADSTKNLIAITSTCKEFRNLLQHPHIWKDIPIPHWLSNDSGNFFHNLAIARDLMAHLECCDTSTLEYVAAHGKYPPDVCGIIYFSEKSARDIWLVLRLGNLVNEITLVWNPEDESFQICGTDSITHTAFLSTTKVSSSISTKMRKTIAINDLRAAWSVKQKTVLLRNNGMMIIDYDDYDNISIEEVSFCEDDSRKYNIASDIKLPNEYGTISHVSRKTLMETLWNDLIVTFSYSAGKLIIETMKTHEIVEISLIDVHGSWKDSTATYMTKYMRIIFDTCFELVKKRVDNPRVHFQFDNNAHLITWANNGNTELVFYSSLSIHRA